VESGGVCIGLWSLFLDRARPALFHILFFSLFVLISVFLFVLFYVLLCVIVYCHRVITQLQLINIIIIIIIIIIHYKHFHMLTSNRTRFHSSGQNYHVSTMHVHCFHLGILRHHTGSSLPPQSPSFRPKKHMNQDFIRKSVGNKLIMPL
jgi:hypothetical protein